MNDPYQTLGVSRSASDAEIKKAYRALCKRWHPDLNPGDPSAEEKFKNVQAAYDAITKGTTQQSPYGQNPYGQQNPYNNAYSTGSYRQSGGTQGQDPFGFGFDPFGFGSSASGASSASYSSADSAEFQAARTYIVNGQYAQARRILDARKVHMARWYYLSALANNGLGQRINALNDARMAVQLEPNNTDYRTLLSQLQNAGQTYRTQSTTYGGQSGMMNWCFRLILLNMFCNCCLGGGGFRMPFLYC